MGLFQFGDFTLASGAKSKWKIECDALTSEDWNALAAMLMDKLEPFGFVYGVPRGGLPLENALKPYSNRNNPSLGDLVVDDVWTTGGSMDRFILGARLKNWSPQRAVIFARNPVPEGVVALFQM